MINVVLTLENFFAMRLREMLRPLLTVSIAAAFFATSASAAPPTKKQSVNAEPAPVETAFVIEPSPFGVAPVAVIGAYEKVIDKLFQREFENTEPGVEMRRLEEKVEQEKDYLKKSLLSLDAPPTTLDGTALAGEFSYGNQESVLRVDVGEKKRTLFFIRGKLWKYIDTYPLGAKSKWGTSFKTALAKLEERTGIPGRLRAADEAVQLHFEEADWSDGKTHMRALNWGKSLAIVHAEVATEARLIELRPFKEKKVEGLDPAVKSILR